MSIKSSVTRFGFQHGPAVVSRVCSDPELGVWIEVMGKRERVTIRVTKSGLLRVGSAEKVASRDYFAAISEPVE